MHERICSQFMRPLFWEVDDTGRKNLACHWYMVTTQIWPLAAIRLNFFAFPLSASLIPPFVLTSLSYSPQGSQATQPSANQGCQGAEGL